MEQQPQEVAGHDLAFPFRAYSTPENSFEQVFNTFNPVRAGFFLSVSTSGVSWDKRGLSSVQEIQDFCSLQSNKV